MIELQLPSTTFLVKKLVKAKVCHFYNMTATLSPSPSTVTQILPQYLVILVYGINLLHLRIQILLGMKVLVMYHGRIRFTHFSVDTRKTHVIILNQKENNFDLTSQS